MRVTVITLILAAMARVGTASPISADNDLQVADPADLVARNTTIPFESDVDESSQVKFYGHCSVQLRAPGICHVKIVVGGSTVDKGCGPESKCKFEDEECSYKQGNDNAHCNL